MFQNILHYLLVKSGEYSHLSLYIVCGGHREWFTIHLVQETPQNLAHLKVQIFKNTAEAGQAMEGMHIQTATQSLKDVTLQKQCMPFHHYNAGVG